MSGGDQRGPGDAWCTGHGWTRDPVVLVIAGDYPTAGQTYVCLPCIQRSIIIGKVERQGGDKDVTE